MFDSMINYFHNIDKNEYKNEAYFDYEDKDTKLSLTAKKQILGSVQGWRRVILKDLLYVFNLSGDKKIKIITYILDNMDSKNRIYIQNYTKTSKKIQVTRQTLSKTIKELLDLNFIKFISKENEEDYYVINPKIVSVYGGNEKQVELITKYNFDNNGNLIKKIDIQ